MSKERGTFLIDGQMMDLEKSKEVRIDEAKEILHFTNDIYNAYVQSSATLKRQYLSFFWQRFEVEAGVIIKSHPTLLFAELLKLKQVSLKTPEIEKPKEYNDSNKVIISMTRLRRQGSNLRPIA